MTLATARRLRREMTRPELDLWFRLRETTPRFRRQHPMGPYVLDFFCPRAKLVVEIDGWSHDTGNQPERDQRRDAWLEARGLTVIRISASEVIRDPDEVADSLHRLALSRLPPPSASPPPPPRSAGEDK